MGPAGKLIVAALLAWAFLGLVATGAESETVLRRGNGAEPETLDVHKSSGVPEATIQRDLFEGLVAEAADGSLIPGAAERWEVSRAIFGIPGASPWGTQTQHCVTQG